MSKINVFSPKHYLQAFFGFIIVAIGIFFIHQSYAAVAENPTPAPGEYIIITYKADEIGETGQYAVIHLHCLYYNENVEGTALYEMYFWASAGTQPKCEPSYAGFLLKSGDVVQIGYSDKIPQQIAYSYSSTYYTRETNSPATGYEFEITINVNQQPPACKSTDNNLPLYDCTIRRSPPPAP